MIIRHISTTKYSYTEKKVREHTKTVHIAHFQKNMLYAQFYVSTTLSIILQCSIVTVILIGKQKCNNNIQYIVNVLKKVQYETWNIK